MNFASRTASSSPFGRGTPRFLAESFRALSRDFTYILKFYVLGGIVLVLAYSGLISLGYSTTFALILMAACVLPVHFLLFKFQSYTGLPGRVSRAVLAYGLVGFYRLVQGLLAKLKIGRPETLSRFVPEPLLIDREIGTYGKLGFDHDFKGTIAHSILGNIETVYFATGLLRLQAPEVLKSVSEPLHLFIKDCYDDSTSLFRLRPHRGTGSLHYAYCAIGAYRNLSNTPRGVPLSLVVYENLVGTATDTARKAQKRMGQVLIERNRNYQRLIELYSSLAVLFNLGGIPAVREAEGSLIPSFVKSFYRYQSTDRRGIRLYPAGGFTSEIDETEPTMSGTYFVIRILKLAGYDATTVVDKEEVLRFLKRCWKKVPETPGGWGFASTPNTRPNLVHTRMAMEIATQLKLSIDEFVEEIMIFTVDCWVSNGFGFRAGFLPNTYASRCAIELMLLFKLQNSEPWKARADLVKHCEDLANQIPKALLKDFYSPSQTFAGYPFAKPIRAALSWLAT